jgi:NAD(P)-dependent dehydrogenase (short-subunit alcohol dehydrogenase family)
MTAIFAVYPSLRDRVVLVTGGASGIGAEHVTPSARQGAKVAFSRYRRQCRIHAERGLSCEALPPPLYLPCDFNEALKRSLTMKLWHDSLPLTEKVLPDATQFHRL